MSIQIFPPEEIIETTVAGLPLSKSIAARALVLQALTPMSPAIPAGCLPDCDDINVLKAALEVRQGAVNIHASGTALRFLTAYFAATEGTDVVVAGTERLAERPIAPLVDALRSLGADIEYVAAEGHAPLRIRGKRLRGGTVALDASKSSQFVSALAMVAPSMADGLRIELGGRVPSMPYLNMTLRMLEARGIDARMEAYTAVIPAGTLRYAEPECEPDWSAASYWYEIAAVTAGWVTLPGLRAGSLQGDSILASIGERFGALTEFTAAGAELSASPDLYSRLDLDMTDYPDLVPALAVTAALIGMPFEFTGVANLRDKECDRLEALRLNLLRLGVIAEVGRDSFGWEGGRMPISEIPSIDPCGDHRIAMAFAAASAFVPGLIIQEPEVVAKSYPGFFDDLAAAGFTISENVTTA